MLRLPVIEGIIKRRLRINFRADPDIVQALLPAGFRPKCHGPYAIVGICLIRLEDIRPRGVPALVPGLSSENAAHRIAVEWTEGNGEEREGVYIPRRDTNSALNALAGGRIFPGEHHYSRFQVEDDGSSLSLAMDSEDVVIEVRGHTADALPESTCFSSLAEASGFFEGGCVGYSATCDPGRLDGIELKTPHWQVAPFEVVRVRSTFFDDPRKFPEGSVRSDHGLVMRDIPHEWHGVPDYRV